MKALTRLQQLTYFLSPPCSHSYYVMQSCWALDSRRRPSFSHLVSSLACQLVEAEGAVSKYRKKKNFILGGPIDYSDLVSLFVVEQAVQGSSGVLEVFKKHVDVALQDIVSGHGSDGWTR